LKKYSRRDDMPKKAKKTKTKKPAKKSKKKIAEQKKLIRTIKNPHRYFKLDVGRYGGEVAMGSITKEQFEFWEGKDDDFAQYMNDRGFDPAEANEKYGVPEAARFDKEFYEYEDICHLSGPEWSEGQTLTITEVDKDGNNIEDDEGRYLEDEQIDLGELEKKGVKVECIAEHDSGSDSCKDKYYLFGQYFNKGGFYTNEIIKTGPDGIDFKKMAIKYENADGFKCFNEIEYDGTAYYLEEDSTGKSSSFYVMEGDDV
jgi:hypothetical protein